MGLDMRPMGKPKKGFEKRYNELFKIIQEEPKDELLKEWFDIQDPSYETIKAPRVGRDREADEWVKQKYNESDKKITESEFIKQYEGHYVIELAKELDGVPMYISPAQDENVFRGKFMQYCVDLIGEDLAKEAWETKLADQTLDYGNRLMEAADKIAKENHLEYLKDQRIPPNTNEDSIESKLHIVFSLAKWLIYYGKNGHGYEADY